MTTPTHGLRKTYLAGCRCQPCCAANTRYAKWRDLVGPRLVDATPARQHIAGLRAAGVGRREIARRSGISQTVIDRLAGVGRHHATAARVRPDTLTAILAVTTDDRAPGSVLDAAGTHRRLQALIAIGWTQTDLANRTGLRLPTVNALAHGRWGKVQHATHLAVRSVFEELSGRPGPSARARAQALRHGWAPPLAWDDETIDDPTATPTGVANPRTPRSRAEVIEDFLDTWDTHLGDVQLAAFRLDITPTALERTLQLARRGGSDIRFHGSAVRTAS